jgi:DNA-binding MarR family transcriptional regulator
VRERSRRRFLVLRDPLRDVLNHALVLACIATDPDVRLKDVAVTVGVTERTAAQIVSELEQAGYLTKTRDCGRNQYEVHEELPLRAPNTNTARSAT